MKHILPDALRAATRLVQSGRLTEATASLQRLLGGSAMLDGTTRKARRAPPASQEAAATHSNAGTADARPTRQNGPASGASFSLHNFGLTAGIGQLAMPASLRGLMDEIGSLKFPLPDGLARPFPVPAPSTPSGAQFLEASFSNQAGARPYKIYVPSSYRPGRRVPLVVMLHGCTQSADDFASGTRMNEAAEAQCCIVVYPAQTSTANRQKCWNWFNAGDQQRDGGEPSLIAGITRAVMRDYAIDPRRIYVAGLSAGGAAAAIMGDTYPDLFAAIGVHSGLACGAAQDMPSAFAAMRRGGDGVARTGDKLRSVPAIIFHGDRDTTVNPRNGDAVAAQAARAARLDIRTETGEAPGGLAYSRALHADANGRIVVEQWVVHGAGHAWFGGSPSGSYTDPRGPDATREMLRFFMEHPHPKPATAA